MGWYNPKWEELTPKAKRLYVLFMILIVYLVVFIMLIGTSHKGSDSSSSVSRRVELTEDMIVGLTSVIQLKGFHCPEVKLAYQRDPDVYGNNQRSGAVPKVRMMFMKKQCLESPLHQSMTRRSHLWI